VRKITQNLHRVKNPSLHAPVLRLGNDGAHADGNCLAVDLSNGRHEELLKLLAKEPYVQDFVERSVEVCVTLECSIRHD